MEDLNMQKKMITEYDISSFRKMLLEKERSIGTVEKYIRDVKNFTKWHNGEQITKESAIRWKQVLLDSGTISKTCDCYT